MDFETTPSDVTVAYDSANCLGSQETLSQDSVIRESMSPEWTDEKHSLYLKSMEASFINDLYNSVDTLRWRSQREDKERSDSCISSAQYKVLRGGYWEKVSSERQKLEMNNANGPRVLLGNPWIQHFRSACREQIVTSSEQQERASFGSPEVRGTGKMELAPAEFTSNLKLFRLCRDDSVGSNPEVTDQNFVDEDSVGEKAKNVCRAKRKRTADAATSRNDQVVPNGERLLTQVRKRF